MTDNNNTKKLAKIINLLNFDWKSRPHLVNRITQIEKVTVFDEAGQPTEKEVEFFISTETMEKLCKLLREQAGLPTVHSSE
ncbi:hypothetical protein EVB68_058 [Rhizobium phage RHph_Y2_6]|uniref:Uncharacterized protein n=2 Tax=Acanvirus TaxID=3044653 RepID=A0AAE8AXK6_9CAUD|nr:hypothetical protein PP748_gp058 [Rhizobium phage RHph_Y2_6]YP_010658364.1 hypothetical protein PP750_gp54 [Rhizobium phage RHEph16]QIG68795.1 hypothetical protein EVB68_058 [Rhizobium phage RHph_Y2_6]QXV74363.1 hypothetical protein [Rhizobium phage RHEph16]